MGDKLGQRLDGVSQSLCFLSVLEGRYIVESTARHLLSHAGGKIILSRSGRTASILPRSGSDILRKRVLCDAKEGFE